MENYNIYQFISTKESKHVPEEVETMYFNQYGKQNHKRFFKTLRQ